MAKLQMDEEPGIRTNTTIRLGKIARNLSDAVSSDEYDESTLLLTSL